MRGVRWLRMTGLMPARHRRLADGPGTGCEQPRDAGATGLGGRTWRLPGGRRRAKRGELRDTRRVNFDPYAPYCAVTTSTVRVVTWNVWGRYGPRHERRQAGLEDILAEAAPDIVCLVEAWRHGGAAMRTAKGRSTRCPRMPGG